MNKLDARHYLTCFWPGLSELWWRGRLSALPLAIGFALLLNALLVLRHLYPNWLDPMLVNSAWYVGLLMWAGWTFKSFRELPELVAPRSVSEHPDRFPQAQAAYLKANWRAAEELLLGILAIDPRDPPALLLLSGVYRHTDRWRSAHALMDELRRLEVADGWLIEISAEDARIANLSEPAGEPSAESATESDLGQQAESSAPPNDSEKQAA